MWFAINDVAWISFVLRFLAFKFCVFLCTLANLIFSVFSGGSADFFIDFLSLGSFWSDRIQDFFFNYYYYYYFEICSLMKETNFKFFSLTLQFAA